MPFSPPERRWFGLCLYKLVVIVYIDLHYYLRKIFKLRDTCFSITEPKNRRSWKFWREVGRRTHGTSPVPIWRVHVPWWRSSKTLGLFEWQAFVAEIIWNTTVYLHTISLGSEMFTRCSWSNFNVRKFRRDTLLGINKLAYTSPKFKEVLKMTTSFH